MSEDHTGASEYIHGSAPEEQQRLALMNGLLNEACLRELGLRGGEAVLDVGSGVGQFTRMMARQVGDTGQVVGVERDPQQIATAEALAAADGEAGLVAFREGDALDLPLWTGEVAGFDVAHARFLLEHMPEPGRVIREMARAVRPGGRVFVSDDDHDNFRPWPAPEGFDAIWDAYVRSFVRLGNDPFVGRKLVSLLREAGLTDIRNTCVFFGGCAGNARFEAVADNLIAAIEGARDEMLSDGVLDEAAYRTGIAGLHRWKADPSAVLWYTVCCAEGTVPG